MTSDVKWDLNILQQRAYELAQEGRHQDAIRIYFQMADGDPSLDGGNVGELIGQCYEAMGQLYAAQYWYGRAVEENPKVQFDSAKARERLEKVVNIDDLIPPEDYTRKQ
jgi:tetratricopeptide (TPR) repeat protein